MDPRFRGDDKILARFRGDKLSSPYNTIHFHDSIVITKIEGAQAMHAIPLEEELLGTVDAENPDIIQFEYPRSDRINELRFMYNEYKKIYIHYLSIVSTFIVISTSLLLAMYYLAIVPTRIKTQDMVDAWWNNTFNVKGADTTCASAYSNGVGCISNHNGGFTSWYSNINTDYCRQLIRALCAKYCVDTTIEHTTPYDYDPAYYPSYYSISRHCEGLYTPTNTLVYGFFIAGIVIAVTMTVACTGIYARSCKRESNNLEDTNQEILARSFQRNENPGLFSTRKKLQALLAEEAQETKDRQEISDMLTGTLSEKGVRDIISAYVI